jgi:hypothetical protein
MMLMMQNTLLKTWDVTESLRRRAARGRRRCRGK